MSIVVRNAAFALLALIGSGCAGSGGWYSNQREQVIEAEAKRGQARIDEDWETLEQVLAKEFVYHMATGAVVDKKAYLELQKAGQVKIVSSALEEDYVRVYEGVALQRGLAKMEVDREGTRQTALLRFLNVWIWRDQRWQLASRQSAFQGSPDD